MILLGRPGEIFHEEDIDGDEFSTMKEKRL